MGSHTKKVSLNMTLGSLRTLIEKLFTLPKNQMKLFLQTDGQTFPEDITRVKDDKRLGDLYIVVRMLVSQSSFMTIGCVGWAADPDK